MLIFGLCEAMQPAIRYGFGAGLMENVRALIRRIVLFAVVLSVVSMLFMRFGGRYVAPLFVKPGDTELLSVSVAAMELFAFSYLVGWVDLCFSSFFTALQKPVRSFLVSLFGTLIFPLVFLFALSRLWGFVGILFMPTVAGACRAVLTLGLACIRTKTTP